MSIDGLGGAIADMLEAHARKQQSDYVDYQALNKQVREGNPPPVFRLASTETMWYLHGETGRHRCVYPSHKNVVICVAGYGAAELFCEGCSAYYLGVNGKGFDHYLYTKEPPE